MATLQEELEELRKVERGYEVLVAHLVAERESARKRIAELESGRNDSAVKERQALLEIVFGSSCQECVYSEIEPGPKTCSFVSGDEPIPATGRRADCPFLPFEVKK